MVLEMIRQYGARDGGAPRWFRQARRARGPAWLLLAVLLGGAPAAAAQPASDAAPRVMQPGDIVRITVWEQPGFSGEFQIAADGTLIHPVYRQLRLGGLSPDEVDGAVRSFLTRYETTPQFVAEPLFRVAVNGAVRQPGFRALRPGTSIADAVIEAGGLTEQANARRLRFVRDGAVSTMNLASTAAARTEVRTGDQIIVPQQRSILRDYISPISSVMSAIGVAVTLVRRTR